MPFPPVQPLFLLDLETSIVADFFFFGLGTALYKSQYQNPLAIVF